MLFKKQQKVISSTTVSNKQQEFFRNWELSDELEDINLMSVSGGVDANVSEGGSSVGLLININALNCLKTL